VGAVAAATTVLRIAALAIVALAELLAFRTGDVRPLRAHGGSSTPLRSSPPCCFSFLGMEGAAMATNRVRDPERNVPRAIIAGVAGVAVLYLAGTLAVLGDGAAGCGSPNRAPHHARAIAAIASVGAPGRAARRAVES
jgi:basic amino acid/polyamine antiporter, APA family